MREQPRARRSAWSARDGSTDAVVVLLGVWFVVVAMCNQPLRQLDRLRRLDRVGLFIPNWRFFAPNPAQHDQHLLYRVENESGAASPWEECCPIDERGWVQMFWFPSRRQQKGIFDHVSSVTAAMRTLTLQQLPTVPSYRVLQEIVEHTLVERYRGRPVPAGFQWAVAQYTGYDNDDEPAFLFVSSFVPLQQPSSPTAA